MGVERPGHRSLEEVCAPDLLAAVPSGGYLRRYVEYGWDSTMSPPEFHLAAGLAQLAIVMGNKVLIRGPGGRLYPPHLWFALVGPAGGARKTSGIQLAMSLVDAAVGEPRSLPTDTTREALWTTLEETPTGYMVWSEFAGFLARTRTEYMSGIKEDLCEWWDSAPEVRRKLQSKSYTVRWPALTILAGGVPERLAELIREQDLFGGFFSRFMFVNQTTEVPYRGLRGHGPERENLHQELRMLAGHEGLQQARYEVSLPADAAGMWEAYDQALWGMPESRDPYLSGFMARCGVNALKLSFSYSLARGSLDPEPEDMANAIAMVELCRQNGSSLVEVAEDNATQDGRNLAKILRTLALQGQKSPGGWVDRSALLAKTRLKARQLEEYLETLEERGEIEQREHATGARPRKEARLA